MPTNQFFNAVQSLYLCSKQCWNAVIDYFRSIDALVVLQ